MKLPALALAVLCTAVAAKDSGLVFVTSEKDHALTLIDARTLEVRGTVATCKRPRHLQFLPGREQILVACSDSNAADVIDIASRKSVRRVPMPENPEAFDLSADGRFAVVVTYLGTFVFPKATAESWPATFAKAPLALEPHLLRQAESVAFSRDGSLIHAVSEGTRSPLVTYRLQR